MDAAIGLSSEVSAVAFPQKLFYLRGTTLCCVDWTTASSLPKELSNFPSPFPHRPPIARYIIIIGYWDSRQAAMTHAYLPTAVGPDPVLDEMQD